MILTFPALLLSCPLFFSTLPILLQLIFFIIYHRKRTVHTEPSAADEFAPSSSSASPDIPLRIDSWCTVLVEYSTMMRVALDNNTLFLLDVESQGAVKDRQGQQNTDRQVDYIHQTYRNGGVN